MMGTGNGIRLGRFFGIPVSLDLSLLVIAGFLTFSLAASYFPAGFPGQAGAVYVAVAAATSVLFFGSVLAHELAHSVVSQRNGTPVKGITLWMLGGMAELGGEPKSAGAEFRIAAVGPLTSLGLAAGFGALAFAVTELGVHGLVGSALAWLAFINLVLAIFNLIPGAPLDGGRILMAALWAWRGDRDRANQGAARAGVVVGTLLIGVGILQFLAGFAGGLWTALIGWFITSAARAEGSQAQLRGRLGEATVGSVMTRDPERVRGWLTVDAFLTEEASGLRHEVVPVENFDGTIAGVLTPDRVRLAPAHERTGARVVDVTVPLDAVRTAEPGDQLVDVLLEPSGSTVDHILVFEGERLVGIVSPRDVERAARWVGAAR